MSRYVVPSAPRSLALTRIRKQPFAYARNNGDDDHTLTISAQRFGGAY
jgi:hypothetical protein